VLAAVPDLAQGCLDCCYGGRLSRLKLSTLRSLRYA
jgi:hypothetical protein